ncbi:MAG: hypothetical protein K2Z81_00365, partial [Cyanobacteria bacterium]|nr:hypothetical protein [Cyanobacteriota bacterium]
VGYVHLSTFKSDHCVAEMGEALEALESANGIILDLRDNPGGCIDYAFEIFALLSDSGTFVSMRGMSGESHYTEQLKLDPDGVTKVYDGELERSTRLTNKLGNKPLIVLVDKTTKSAAEMLAGALRDNGRATVVGTRTFGKGIVQRVWEFANKTSMKMSALQYFLPTGESINKIGLEPDFVIPANKKDGGTSNCDVKALRTVDQKTRAARRISDTVAIRLHQLDEIEGSADRQLSFAYREVRRKLKVTKAPLLTRYQAVSSQRPNQP